jgi:hypothetical protein
MIIWLAICIPILTSLFLFFVFRHKTVWWEFLIPFGVSILAIFISKVIIDAANTHDIEYWGSIVTESRYYEDWNEYIHQTCTRTVGSGDNQRTETYDCSYVQYHSEYWMIYTTSGESMNVNKDTYHYLVKKFGKKPTFKDMHRSHHTDDGDMYWVKWDRSKERAEPVVTEHSYTNKVQASDDVFNFPEVDTMEVRLYGLYDYPEHNNVFDYSGLLGSDDQEAHKELEYVNGLVGPEKQCRIWILLYDYRTRQAGLTQQALWKGGNKNELIVTIGVDDTLGVRWCYPFSWSESEIVKVNIRTFIEGKKLDFMKTIPYITQQVKTSFERKQFVEFDYLTIEPSTAAVIWVFVIVILINVGISFFVVKNEWEEDSLYRDRNW